MSHWDIEVFERQRNGTYRLHSETILEKAFPLHRIKTALSKRFSSVRVVDLKKERPSRSSEKLHFIAKK